MLTEEEAKGKWCPFARVGYHEGGEGTTFNRGVVFTKSARDFSNMVVCLGSQCSAWRWRRSWSRDDETGLNQADEPTRGYCGLAGKPE